MVKKYFFERGWDDFYHSAEEIGEIKRLASIRAVEVGIYADVTQAHDEDFDALELFKNDSKAIDDFCEGIK